MKHKTLFNLCKACGIFCLFDHTDAETGTVSQWLGSGSFAYPIFKLPYLTKEFLIEMLDLTSKQVEKITFRHLPNLPGTVSFLDSDPSDILLCQNFPRFIHNGDVVQPLSTSAGLKFIDMSYLTPLSDIEDLELYERRGTDNKIYFVAKVGLLVVGVILPTEQIINEDFTYKLETLARECRKAFMIKNEKESE